MALYPFALQKENEDRYRDTIEVLTTLIQTSRKEWAYIGSSPAARLLAEHGRIEAKERGYYRATEQYSVWEMREIYRELV